MGDKCSQSAISSISSMLIRVRPTTSLVPNAKWRRQFRSLEKDANECWKRQVEWRVLARHFALTLLGMKAYLYKYIH